MLDPDAAGAMAISLDGWDAIGDSVVVSPWIDFRVVPRLKMPQSDANQREIKPIHSLAHSSAGGARP